MTDWNEAASTTDAFGDPIGDAAERGIDHVKAIAAELVEASRSAAQSVLDEEKEKAARQVVSVAAAVRSAAQSLDHSNLPILTHYTDRAAGTIESFGHALSGRRWSELADDLEILARRRPALFITAAAIAGFLVGRLVWASRDRAAAARRRQVSEAMAVERETEAVIAAVASAEGEEIFEPPVGVSGTRDTLR
jgi:hypothetical protein